MNAVSKPLSWNDIDPWEVSVAPKKPLTWNGIESWENVFNSHFGEKLQCLVQLLVQSSERLNSLGGDPLNYDWNTFRPIKIGREEDWSDWLAFLIEKSNGSFNSLLFSEPIEKDLQLPLVQREFYSGGYFADIVITWKDNSYTHLEVKVGDPHLSKTFGNSEQLRRELGGEWSDYILLLPEQKEDWTTTESRIEGKHDFKIKSLTWLDVVSATRQCLYSQSEKIDWLIWAKAFTGCVEQKMLGFYGEKELKGLRFQNSFSSTIILQQQVNLQQCLTKR